MATCRLERYYAVGVDFIQEGLIFKWSTDNNAVVLKEGQGTAKILVVTDGAVTVNFILKCVVSSPSGDTKIVEKSITHERIEFNPTIPDPFGKNRAAILLPLSRDLIFKKSGDIALHTNSVNGLLGITKWTECKNNKYGWEAKGDGLLFDHYFVNTYGVSTYVANSLLFITNMTSYTAGQAYPVVQCGYVHDSNEDISGIMSDYLCNYYVKDNKLYTRLRLFGAGSGGIGDTLGTINESGISFSDLTFDIPLFLDELVIGKAYSIAAVKTYRKPGTNIDEILYIVDGVVTNKLVITHAAVDEVINVGGGTNVLGIRVGMSAKESNKDIGQGDFLLSNIRLFSGTTATQSMPSITEMKLMSLELNNCQPLTTP